MHNLSIHKSKIKKNHKTHTRWGTGRSCALRLMPVSGKYAGLHARRERQDRTARLMDRLAGGQAGTDKLKMKSNARDLQ